MRNKSLAYISAALLLFVLSFGRITDLAPLGVGSVIALSALGLNAPVLSAFLLLSGIYGFSPVNFSFFASTAVAMCVLWLTERKVALKKYWYIVGAFASQLGLIIAGAIMHTSAVAILLGAFFSLVFAYLCYSFGVPVIKNKLRYKLLDSEQISGCIVLAAFAYGLSSMPIGFPVEAFFYAIITLIGCFVLGAGGLVAGLSFALGTVFSGGIDLIGAFALMSLSALIFVPAPRILSALSLIMSFVLYTFFFNIIPSNGWMWALSLLLGGLTYIVLPRSRLVAMRDFFSPDGRKVLRSMVNRSRVATGVKLQAVGNVFGEMGSIMNAESGEISEVHRSELTESLVGSVCALCGKYTKCLSLGVIPCVGNVMEAALSGGRVSVADLPDQIKNNCISLASLISASGRLADEYTQRLSKMRNIDFAKKMVASQLSGVSNILVDLARRQSEPLKFDDEIEKKIAEELTYRRVVTSEALVSSSGSSVMLAVLSSSIDESTIKFVLKKLLGNPYIVERSEDGSISGWSVVYCTARPKFDVVFSVCACPKDKSSASGDTHSFIKIDSHRFMMAVCDGMGSGEKASKFSASTISLIESFYRAGFEHELVLESVNNFLSLSSEEIYSAVDIAVVDLDDGQCDIIKIGSPTSFIKTKDSVFTVEGSSLPIGVLEEMKPSVISYKLSGDETVLLTSDGVSVFNENELCDIINGASKLPEPLCKKVVEAALSKGGGSDDITAVAFHIYETV